MLDATQYYLDVLALSGGSGPRLEFLFTRQSVRRLVVSERTEFQGVSYTSWVEFSHAAPRVGVRAGEVQSLTNYLAREVLWLYTAEELIFC